MPEEPEVELVFHESLTSLVTPAFCRTVLQALATPRAHLPARPATAHMGRTGDLRDVVERPAAGPDGGQPAPLSVPSPRPISSGLRRLCSVRPLRAHARRPAPGPRPEARRIRPALQRQPGRTLRVPRGRDRQLSRL